MSGAFMRAWESIMGSNFAVVNITGVPRATADGFIKACGSQDDAGERLVEYMNEYIANNGNRIKDKPS